MGCTHIFLVNCKKHSRWGGGVQCLPPCIRVKEIIVLSFLKLSEIRYAVLNTQSLFNIGYVITDGLRGKSIYYRMSSKVHRFCIGGPWNRLQLRNTACLNFRSLWLCLHGLTGPLYNKLDRSGSREKN